MTDETHGATPDQPTEPLPPVTDERPTQPLPAFSEGEPTQVLPPVAAAPRDLPPTVAPPAADAGVAPVAQPGNRATKIALWVAVALVVVLALSLIAALLSRGGDATPAVSESPSATPTVSESAQPSPSPSPSLTVTPSAAPEPEPEPEPEPAPPPPAPSGPQFTAFSAPSTVACADEYSSGDVTISWSSSNAAKAWIGVATNNAKLQPYAEVPPAGSETLPFPCSNASQTYTVTLEDPDGVLAHKTVTVNRQLP